ncbi:MAG: chromosomal replication initiator protein DnaA, partial [Clostridia bacterium]|nr:chromosomal replication initiator protein DnaA [Clostridia bacterium]
IAAIGAGSTEPFHDKYRNVDVLLVDDVQFIGGKESTQEEFFHTFNALYESNKQIVLASDRPPKEMATLEERLRTRFEWGLITDIQPPDLETRMAIVNAKARTFGLELTYEVSEFIAASITSNVRQLEGVVKKIAALQAILPQSTIDRSIAERAIRDIRQENPGLSPTPDLILTEVSSFTGITKDKILGRSKSKEIARARQILVYLITEMTELSLPDIGRFIGRDHTTALYARDKIRGEIQVDPELAATIKDLKKNIRNR